MRLPEFLLPALRDVLTRHIITGAGAVGVTGDDVATQSAGAAALAVSVGLAVSGELRKRRRAKKAAEKKPD